MGMGSLMREIVVEGKGKKARGEGEDRNEVGGTGRRETGEDFQGGYACGGDGWACLGEEFADLLTGRYGDGWGAVQATSGSARAETRSSSLGSSRL